MCFKLRQCNPCNVIIDISQKVGDAELEDTAWIKKKENCNDFRCCVKDYQFEFELADEECENLSQFTSVSNW